MNEPFRDLSTRFHPDPALLAFTPPVQAAEGGYTPEEAAAEAGRCRECRCDACVTYCDLMRSFHKYPKRIEEEVTTTIEPVSLSRKARLATRLIATCDQCGLCKAVCPAGIDVGAFLRESQRKMQELGAMPWAFHEFWLRDMAFANGEASLLLSPSGSKTPPYLFFPGCRLSGSLPELTEKAFDALREIAPDSAILLSCCGAPASWAGKEALHEAALAHLRDAWRSLGKPTLVFACMSCRREFDRYLPETASTSIYELLDAGGAVPAAAETAAAVFDPCSSRDYPDAQRAVRSLAEKARFRLAPLPMEGKYARCCGWGGHVALANPGYAGDVTASRARESDAPYLTYCANCRDVFAKAGKPAAHVLEILFGAPAWERRAPTASESRENRLALKRRLRERFSPEEATSVEEPKRRLAISRELLEKMDRDHLLREDAEAAVLRCEESGRFLVDAERGSRTGHTRVGNTTVWVEYRAAGDGFELLNAYAHRMRIVEGDANG
jgi:Fe-S oxidoreductase